MKPWRQMYVGYTADINALYSTRRIIFAPNPFLAQERLNNYFMTNKCYIEDSDQYKASVILAISRYQDVLKKPTFLNEFFDYKKTLFEDFNIQNVSHWGTNVEEYVSLMAHFGFKPRAILEDALYNVFNLKTLLKPEDFSALSEEISAIYNAL